jgi:hypothetical protein
MRNFPIEQIGKGQGRPLEMLIQPDAEVVQADFSRQTSLKSGECMWTFSRQTKGVEQFLKNRLNALTQASQPPMQLFGLGLLASLMRWRNDFGFILLPIDVASCGHHERETEASG